MTDKNITPEQFVHWLQGFLDAKPYGGSDLVETLQAKIKTIELKTAPATLVPYWWQVNTPGVTTANWRVVPNNPGSDAYKITCNGTPSATLSNAMGTNTQVGYA